MIINDENIAKARTGLNSLAESSFNAGEVPIWEIAGDAAILRFDPRLQPMAAELHEDLIATKASEYPAIAPNASIEEGAIYKSYGT